MARPTAANAAVTYTPVAYTKTRLAGSMERHIANRFGCGWTPALGKEIALAGGWKLWFERQLSGLLVDDTFYKTSATWWPSINASNASDADLLVTRDYRSVLGEVVSSRFGASTAAVFPGVTMETIGAMA